MSYICVNCENESLKWSGKCPNCGEWGSLKEKENHARGGSAFGGKKSFSRAKPVKIEKLGLYKSTSKKRFSTKIGEIDRVLGGGLVSGQVVLLSGDPGIGKSTLLLQLCLKVPKSKDVLYVSGEESIDQITNRLERINGGSNTKGIDVTEDTDVDRIISTMEDTKPGLVVIDSIQSLSTSDISGFAGSISQVRECGMRLTRTSKKSSIPMIIVGQVTKDGNVAGPKVLEHVVDTVLYFEGDELGLYRILRCNKNRFGPTDEVGLFEMTGKGLNDIEDSTKLINTSDGKKTIGMAKSAVFKGSRVLVVEIQALTSPASFGSPRRLPTGFSKTRLEMLCAVLTRRAGINLGGDDVFVNVMGGLNLKDPAIDLAVCMAIASAKKDKPVGNTVFVGEVGLSGEIREVPFQKKIKSDVVRRKMAFISSTNGKTTLISLLKSLF